MPKSWEMTLTKDHLHLFEQILNDLRVNRVSYICPFNSSQCNRSAPTCASFVKGLKRIDNSTETACPCYKFRPAALIGRIERLLKYNSFVQSTNEGGEVK